MATAMMKLRPPTRFYTCGVCRHVSALANLLLGEHRVTGKRRLFCPNCNWDTGIKSEEA